MNEIGAWITILAILLLVPWAAVLSLLTYHRLTEPGRVPSVRRAEVIAESSKAIGNWLTWGLAIVVLLVLGIIIDAGAS